MNLTSHDFFRESKRWHHKWIKEPLVGPMVWSKKQLKLVPKKLETESEFRKRKKEETNKNNIVETSSSDGSGDEYTTQNKKCSQSRPYFLTTNRHAMLDYKHKEQKMREKLIAQRNNHNKRDFADLMAKKYIQAEQTIIIGMK